MATALATANRPKVPDTLEAICAHELQRIKTVRTQIVIDHPFWATLLLPMEIELAINLPTFAATDCVNKVWINPLFTIHLTLKELGYILVHEVCHMIFLHGEVRTGMRDPHDWNEAGDYVINLIIDELQEQEGGRYLYQRPVDVPVPDLGLTISLLHNPDYKGMATEAVYEIVHKEHRKHPQKCPICGQQHGAPQAGKTGQNGGAPPPASQKQNGQQAGGNSQPQAGAPTPPTPSPGTPPTGSAGANGAPPPQTSGNGQPTSGQGNPQPGGSAAPQGHQANGDPQTGAGAGAGKKGRQKAPDPRQGNLFGDILRPAPQCPNANGQTGQGTGSGQAQDGAGQPGQNGSGLPGPQDSPHGAGPDGSGQNGTGGTPCPLAGGGDGLPDFRGHCTPGVTDLLLPRHLNEQQRQDIIDRVIRAHQVWKMHQRGTMPDGLARYLKHLQEARVPWQRVFASYAWQALAKDDYSLSPPHKRWLMEGIVRPTLRSETLGTLIVHIDTSGSTQSILPEFAAELKKLYTLAEETTLLIGDAKIHQVIQTHEIEQFLKTLKFQGGGGTSHVPVFEWIKKAQVLPDLLVCLTDLVSEFPHRKPDFPVLWCTKEDHGAGPGWGRLVVIPEKQAAAQRAA